MEPESFNLQSEVVLLNIKLINHPNSQLHLVQTQEKHQADSNLCQSQLH